MTLADVAAHAGVSRATASLVLRESPLVAEQTRQRVLASVEALGYVYNRGAASLRMRRTNTIGLVISGLANPFFADLTEGVEEELRPAGYVVLLANTFDDPAHQDMLIRSMMEHQIDGLLIVAAVDSDAGFVTPLRNNGVPHVMTTRRIRGVHASYVGPDDDAGARLATQHLLDHGARELAYFGGPEHGVARIDRVAAMAALLAENGLEPEPSWTVPSRVSSSEGYAMARKLLEHGPPPEAVICHSDAIAFGLMRALRDVGVEIGTGCRVIGYDDVEHAQAWSPSLTSVSVAARTMGRRAARMLMERIEAPGSSPEESLVLRPSLVVRESCGCRPSSAH
ncbi:LacI family DNA-binding transcriptional regulator [Phytoactinopolyspora halotolerans]|uniref:LacI family transcriptional regulator n=1 Tax=Phytoactinopolyspora halotolerans TaxID=1981512 RepID=A0A6L9S4Q2_9ACTN|nr:LacI family DNA-binding transcriptional regulator [Phytoactinopolyspora halotolerans]NED99491.1 LacI family transcriptional regulator [Phytoactinopolyspora halotolerans]